MLQDIAPYKLNNEFLPRASLPVDDASLLVLREGNQLFCRMESGKLELPVAKDFNSLRYLIAVDGCRFYMPTEEKTGKEAAEKMAASGFAFHNTRELRYTSPDWLRFGALTAWQAAGWYQANKYCGRCAAAMYPGEKERSLVCPVCGNTVYPRLCPVVIVGVICGERLLLTKYAGRGAYANYALVAGFAEIGETIEQTVAREVMEETGLRVKNLHYYKSQPWAYSESLLFGFFCEAEEPAEIIVDRNELSLAEWTSRENIPEYEGEISLTYEMMNRFREKGRAGLTEEPQWW